MDTSTVVVVPLEQFRGYLVLQSSLNDSLEGSRTKYGVVAFVGNRIDCPIGDGQFEVDLVQLLFQPFQLQSDNLPDLILAERFEDDRIVDSI